MEKVSNEALIIAHRGAVDQFNENTIEAYEQSKKDGANWIEIDIRMTSNGEVNDLTWKQLSQFETVKNGHSAPIPKLEAVFQKFGQKMDY